MIRFLKPDDMAAAQELWSYCFHEDPAFTDWYFSRRCAPGNALGWFEGGDLLSMVHMIPHTLIVRGAAFKTSLIVGVATWPHARGRGLASRLLEKALQEASLRDEDFLPLYPFDHAFYSKYGWAAAYRRAHFEIPLRDLARYGAQSVSLLPAAPDEQSEAYAEVYSRAMSRFSGYCQRDLREWSLRAEEMRADGARGILAHSAGRPVGAMIYAQDQEAGVLEVQEWMAVTPEAERAFLGYLGAHASTLGHARLWLPNDAPLCPLLPGALEGYRVALDAMVRLVDAKRVIERLGLSGPPITLRIGDPQIKENDGVFRLADGRLSPSDGPADADITIAGLALLAMGAAGSEELAWTGALHGSEDACGRLSEWFPRISTCIFEHW